MKKNKKDCFLVQEEIEALQKAVDLARKASDEGAAPFGAVIMKDNQILAATSNQTLAEDNPISHAEIVAIREAAKVHGGKALEGGTIFCSCEPCMMCMAAIFYAGISKVVYAATLGDAIAFDSGDPPITSAWLKLEGKLDIELVGGCLREDAVAIFMEHIQKYGQM